MASRADPRPPPACTAGHEPDLECFRACLPQRGPQTRGASRRAPLKPSTGEESPNVRRLPQSPEKPSTEEDSSQHSSGQPTRNHGSLSEVS